MKTAINTNKPTPSNHFGVCLASMGLVYVFLCYFYFTNHEVINEYVLFIPVAYGIPITLYELFVMKVWQRSSTGISKEVHPIDFGRVLTKYFGFCMVLLTCTFLYWLLPEYRDGMYQRGFTLAALWLPYILPTGFVYFLWMDGRQKDPQDDYWHTGRFFLGYMREADKAKIANLARGWLVKAFFLPLMAHFLYNEMSQFANTQFAWPQVASWEEWSFFTNQNFYGLYDQILRLILIADLIPACIGYTLTIKALDTHIRTADDSMRGWLFCLICYPPIWTALAYSHYLPYMDSHNWSVWLGDSWLRWPWAFTLILCMGIYASASVCYGTRWSNLTYRGLMCDGPYRITRHPAYFFKNISWWLIGIPFIVEGTLTDSIKQCFFSAGVSYLYFMRAVTEEKHLSRYPEYRHYALWMNDHGWLRFLYKPFPFLKYDPAKYGY